MHALHEATTVMNVPMLLSLDLPNTALRGQLVPGHRCVDPECSQHHTLTRHDHTNQVDSFESHALEGSFISLFRLSPAAEGRYAFKVVDGQAVAQDPISIYQTLQPSAPFRQRVSFR